MVSVQARIAEELGVKEQQVQAAVDLLDGGATVPFIARYRKEATGSLDDAQLRTLEERLRYLRELEARRKVILESVREQGKLDATLEAAIMAADSKGRLEDIYLPFKPKRRTKAEIAKEAGLQPLADLLLKEPHTVPAVSAEPYVSADKNVADVAAALDGARAILVERFAENADLIGALREEFWANGRLASKVREGKNEAGAKFSDYFDFSEALAKMPSHRVLALFRGEREEILDLAMEPDDPATRPAASAPLSPAPTSCVSCGLTASPTRDGRATNGSPIPCAGRGARRSSSCCRSTSGCACGRRPRKKRCGCSPPICATCCSPLPPARGRRSGSTPAFGPA